MIEETIDGQTLQETELGQDGEEVHGTVAPGVIPTEPGAKPKLELPADPDLDEDPVVDSVLSEDWGRVPATDPEGSASVSN
jgi:hypothetical protein